MYDVDVAIKTIGNICKAEGVSLEELRRHFPNRPTTEQECTKIATWLGEHVSRKHSGFSINPPRPSLPQVIELPANLDKNGKPRATRYALRDKDGEVLFYRVKAGRKPGFYFVDVQASDETYPIRNPGRKDAILRAIAANPEAALALYGQEIGACGRCGRTLTSEYRKLGIGPVCIDK
jgi:hypothetical protein